MNSTWKIRIVLVLGVAVIIFGDFLGYGNANSAAEMQVKKHDVQKRALIMDDSGENKVEDNKDSSSGGEGVHKIKVGDTLREACLPKLLCEMASRPWNSLTDKERDLLNLIKSTTMSLSVALSPTRWHFAAHMGQLLRSSDGGATFGCSQLWPTCPFSSKKLLSISTKFAFR